jgi:hypothetical protein
MLEYGLRIQAFNPKASSKRAGHDIHVFQVRWQGDYAASARFLMRLVDIEPKVTVDRLAVRHEASSKGPNQVEVSSDLLLYVDGSATSAPIERIGPSSSVADIAADCQIEGDWPRTLDLFEGERTSELMIPFGADEVVLKGIIRIEGGGYLSLLVGPDGKTYFARAGSRLKDGTIRAIDAASVTLDQQTHDGGTREVRKALNSGEPRQ